jgi:hypothetical protein
VLLACAAGVCCWRVLACVLACAGVRAQVFAHQKAIMEGTRQLIDAFGRKQRAQKAQDTWVGLLAKGGASGERAEAQDEASDGPGGGGDAGNSGGSPPVSQRPAAPRGRAARARGGRAALMAGGGRTGMDPDLASGTLPIHLHLPRIARLHQHDRNGVYGRRGGSGGEVPKPSLVPPPAAEFLGAAVGRDADGGVDQTSWKDLARSYGLHLLPEGGGGSHAALLHDNLSSVLKEPPPPPELRYGEHAREPPREPPRETLAARDLSNSPSLPMLSPGRPGARNWITFLHGGAELTAGRS